MDRRTFLGATAALSLLGSCGVPDQDDRGRAGTGNAGTLTFANRLRIPPVADPDVDAGGVLRYELRVQPGRAELLSGRPSTTFGVNGPYLGPTLRAARGDRVAITVRNGLSDVTTMHWHGMRLPAQMDGGPHQPIPPGAAWTPTWTVDQPAATSWYHPHPHGTTALQTYRGVAGLFLLDDERSWRLGLPRRYGVDDLPLILQDKTFTADGQLSEAAPGWGATFGILGDHILVNGTHDPYLEVTTTRVRFRLVNASNARVYHLGFADRRAFQVIGTDGGLLASPVPADQVRLSPGERIEIVTGFAPGEQVVLSSSPGDAVVDRGSFDLVKIIARARLEPSPPLPDGLDDPARIDPPSGGTVRRFSLSGSRRINAKEWDMRRVDEVVPAGAREIWEVENLVYAHNFHIHEVAFRVLDVGGRPPPAWEQGPKDTVYLPGGQTVRLAVQFGRYTDPFSPYMYHCHILFHEDKGMMGQFLVVEPGTETRVDRTLPERPGHHG